MRIKRITAFLLANVAAAALALSPAVVACASAAQQNQRSIAAKADFPASAAGNLARRVIEAINSGDKTAQSNFIASSFTDEASKRTPPERRLETFQKLYAQSGGFELVEIIPTKEPGEVQFKLRSKQGNYWMEAIVRAAAAQPDKVDGIGIWRVEDPESEKATALPEAKVSEAEAIKHIERYVGNAAAKDRFSGVVMVAKGDRVIFNKAYGLAERGFGTANRLDTKFNLGSMNKMFTSVAIAQLVQAGKLSYEDKLAKVLPEYPNKQTAEKITIHHLLTHTSGLGDFFRPEFFQNRERYKNPKDYFPIFASDPLLFEPGKSWRYSNAAFIVLGAVVEKLSGQNYFDYVRDHIFLPAGMRDTASYAANEVVANLATGYTRFGSNDPLEIDPRLNNVMTLPLKGSPAGGGYSTAPDLLRFAQALRGHKLLDERLSETVTGGKVDTAWGTRYGYGFSDKQMNGKRVTGHGGGAPGINSDLEIFWDGSYTVIVVGNYDPPAAQDVSQKIAEFLARQ